MPTYRYCWKKCGHLFEHTEHLAKHESAHPRCPPCASEKCLHVPQPCIAKTSKIELRSRLASIRPWNG
ncbi:FmdB family transcriptional regulator [Paraburkholderia aromaticivorans]|uniref:FmdB family transcriptional regulator n=1 Tax=Paraburkholderia aromaticivorans TaxID=2026199 RepID=A0A248VIY9_9BURK|nr:FmdB family transcriptional regulator [Paraburkholderia aromaticivorans]